MSRFFMLYSVLFLAISPLVSGQTNQDDDARRLLVELGSLLQEIPGTDQDCMDLLNRIKMWQQEKLNELERQNLTIRMLEPQDGDAVPVNPTARGTISDPDANVWVIVHPLEVSDFWVQPFVTVKRDSSWKVRIHVGRPGSIDVGKHFDIMAVANPTINLYEGLVLKRWPEAECRTEIIEVTRR